MTAKNRASPEASTPADLESNHGGQFVGRMFSGFGHIDELRPAQVQLPAEEPYRPLRQSKARSGVIYRLPWSILHATGTGKFSRDRRDDGP